MSELVGWFTEQVKPTINRPRGRNYASFVTSLHILEELLEKKANMSDFIEAFERMQQCSPLGFESKPGVALLRRRFEWINARGFFDVSQGVNAVRRPYTMDSFLAASVYNIPSKTWHISFFTESQPLYTDYEDNVFPFPSQNFNSVSFTRRPDFTTFLKERPDLGQTLRPVSITRGAREPTERTLAECFVRRVVKGGSINNIAFPHL